MKKVLIIMIFVLLLTLNINKNDSNTLKIATTTSFVNTGVLDYLIEEYKKEYNINIEYLSVGSGKAIELGKVKEVDILILHSDNLIEEELVKNGFTENRISFIENEFIFVSANEFKDMWDITFVSRGDNSGTHVRELEIWMGSDFKKPSNYIETGQGMLDTLIITDQLEGTTLIDSGTWTANKDKVTSLSPYPIEEKYAKNIYSIHTVTTNNEENMKEANLFSNWITSNETINKIENFKINEYGKSLFYKYEE